MSEINSKCSHCKERFNCRTFDVVVCNECKNISHENCFMSKKNCGSCKCSDFTHESELIEGTQDHINVLSTKKTKFKPNIISKLRFVKRIFPLSYYFLRFFYDYSKIIHDKNELNVFLTGIQWSLNINVTVIGEEKILDHNNEGEKREKRIFVANHCGEHDAIIIPKIFDTAVIASVAINKTIIGRMMKTYSDVIEIERGIKSDSVQKMEEYLKKDENKSLFVFPTSIYDNKNTLSLFRTGAFVVATNVGCPIQPVVIKYKQDISSMDILHILMLKRLDVTVQILDPIYNDSNKSPKDFADEVRQVFNKEGGLLLSNVDSHDVQDRN